jgi:two-component system chemotaxis sensor kinase CheA
LLALEKDPAPAEKGEIFKTLFRTAHSLKGAARSVNVREVESACHCLEDIFGAARDGLLPLAHDLFQLLFATADAIRIAGEGLRARQRSAGDALAKLLARLEDAAAMTAVRPPEPLSGQPDFPAQRTVAEPLAGEALVRVLSSKLDALHAHSGELLIARRRIEARNQAALDLQELVKRLQGEWAVSAKAIRKLLNQNEANNSGLGVSAGATTRITLPRRAQAGMDRNTENLRRLARDVERLVAVLMADGRTLEQASSPLETEIRRLRMVPFVEACEGLARMVRDLAKAGGKEANLVVEGGDVGLDRLILEGLKSPLIHLVRNAVDHGIETVAERLAAGKPARGRVTVQAVIRGPRVQLVVSDDGRGLQLENIREQARKKKISLPDDDNELARLIFLPGFSTTGMITDLSGRGIGLDVVKSRVEELHGTVDFSFESGRGTSFVLTSPLTLSTVRALLLDCGGQTFAIDGTSVHKLLRVGRDDLRSIEGQEVLLLGGAPVPIIALRALLGMQYREPAHPGGKLHVIVLSAENHRMAFVVDELLDEQEVVIASLGARLGRIKNFLGATILPTGRIALILNPIHLVRSGIGLSSAETLSPALTEIVPPAKKRLLVVEDSVTTRTLEKSILETAGYEVVVAANGSQAWQLLQEKEVDLVIADIEMPRMDGFALTEAIRGSKRFRDLPVILLTALESDKDKTRGLEAGADAYLLKSTFDQKNLLETIAQLL